MVKEINTTGLAREYIIHPGETLSEVIEDRNMTQRELAIRTGMTEKHISTVIHGQKGISVAFAKKLEYALGIEASFWINLQANYDRELLELEEMNHISEEETAVLKRLKEVTEKWQSFGWLEKDSDKVTLVLKYRKLLGVSNLLDVPELSCSAAYRIQRKNTNADPFVLFAWQRMCEMLTKDMQITDEMDIEKLRQIIPQIKQVMFMQENQIQKTLADLFASCGIAFRVVPCFKGAPVQGFIRKTNDERFILCLTLRNKWADTFWFTLFHEVAHILNGDTKQVFVDFESLGGSVEKKADQLSGNILIDPKEYQIFVKGEGYANPDEIRRFAETQQVKDYIVLGHLMKDNLIPWYAREKYEWDI